MSCHIVSVLLLASYCTLVTQLVSAATTCSSDADCLNGGVCEKLPSSTVNFIDDHGDLFDEFYCRCPSAYWGDFCEEVCPIACKNNGACRLVSEDHIGLNAVSDFACSCPTGYSGRLCQDVSTASPTNPPTNPPNRLSSNPPPNQISNESNSNTKRKGVIAAGIIGSLAGVLLVVLILEAVCKSEPPETAQARQSNEANRRNDVGGEPNRTMEEEPNNDIEGDVAEATGTLA